MNGLEANDDGGGSNEAPGEPNGVVIIYDAKHVFWNSIPKKTSFAYKHN